MPGDHDIHTVDMKGFKDLLTFASETRLPFCIWGEKAVGKTTGVYDWAEAHTYRCVVLHLATQDVVDLIGMMKVVEMPVVEGKPIKIVGDGGAIFTISKCKDGSTTKTDEDGNAEIWVNDGSLSKTIWSRPEWLFDDGVPTLYFLDEFNRGNQFVLAAMLPFLIEGRMHTHRIGPKDFVVAACNPSTGNYNVNDSFEADDALRDRCGHAILMPSKEEWYSYAKNRVGHTTMKVIKKKEKHIELKTFKMPFHVEPSRRSIVNVMSQVESRPSEWIYKHARNVLLTYLGNDWTDEWLSQYTDRLDYLDIDTLKAFDENKAVIERTISTTIKGKPAIKNDIFETAQDSIVDYLKDEYKDGEDDIDWLMKFFSLPVIPKDSVIALLTKFVTLDKPVLYSTILRSGLFNELDAIKKWQSNVKALEIR
jgi:hypothetical protein